MTTPDLQPSVAPNPEFTSFVTHIATSEIKVLLGTIILYRPDDRFAAQDIREAYIDGQVDPPVWLPN